MGILDKIADIEKEIARTQKNKGYNYIISMVLLMYIDRVLYILFKYIIIF